MESGIPSDGNKMALGVRSRLNGIGLTTHRKCGKITHGRLPEP